MSNHVVPKTMPIHTAVREGSSPKYFQVCDDGICLITDYGQSKTREMVIPREIFIEAWNKYIPCLNKV